MAKPLLDALREAAGLLRIVVIRHRGVWSDVQLDIAHRVLAECDAAEQDIGPDGEPRSLPHSHTDRGVQQAKQLLIESAQQSEGASDWREGYNKALIELLQNCGIYPEYVPATFIFKDGP